MIACADVPGYEGLYQITTNGELYSKATNKRRKTEVSRNGYERVCLWRDGKAKHYSIHRIVALAFIPNPDNLDMINHIDGNKLNNTVTNLEWCNASQNMRHAYANNLVSLKTRKVAQYTKNLTLIRIWNGITEASKALKINHANIVTVCQQTTNRRYAGGYIWRYYEC